jgi:hypothetical protein
MLNRVWVSLWGLLPRISDAVFASIGLAADIMRRVNFLEVHRGVTDLAGSS